ncbi:hypothetical protein A3753_05020 [Sulfitobacter sp. HI0082]|nr:hypothetical protein A3753_05020 [Sulfitobacter sp. HI0082]HAC49946.1 hypothetical protein [Sulfitobacter sp.]
MIERGIYLECKFAVRLEKIVILRADGLENFSEMPRAMQQGSQKKWPKRRKCARFGLEGDGERREKGARG